MKSPSRAATHTDPRGGPGPHGLIRPVIRPCSRPSRFESGTVGPPLRLWRRQQQFGAARFLRDAREENLDKYQLWSTLRVRPAVGTEGTLRVEGWTTETRPWSTSRLSHVQETEERGARRAWTAPTTPHVLNNGRPPFKDPLGRSHVVDGVPSPSPCSCLLSPCAASAVSLLHTHLGPDGLHRHKSAPGAAVTTWSQSLHHQLAHGARARGPARKGGSRRHV